MSDTLCVIQCGKKKIWDVKPWLGKVPAKEAYISSYVRTLIKYAEKFHRNSWVILSAKYGFLHPWELIENYNISFNDIEITNELIQKLRKQANEKGLMKYDKIIVLAGSKYCQICELVFQGKKIYTPIKGMGIVQAIKLIKYAIETNTPFV